MNTAQIDYNDPSSIMSALASPIPEVGKPEELQRTAKHKVKAIFASYQKLQEILYRHEATIQRRWLKRKKHQRLQVLLTAWPNMPASHRPDYYAYRKAGTQLQSSGMQYRDHFMWPYINQEDLVKPKILLLLLKARGRSPPSTFAAVDYDAMHLGLVTRAISPVFLNQHTLLLNGITSEEDYGTLVTWEDHPEAFDWMHTGKQFPPGEGMLVLEAQERLAAFLVECCIQILCDINQDELLSGRYPVQPEPSARSEINENGFTSLTVIVEETPYRVPTQLDFAKLEYLIATSTGAAEDYLWLLREDPSFFAEQIYEYKEHRQELIPDMNGNAHPVLKQGRDNIFWDRVCRNLVIEAYVPLEMWSQLYRQVQALGVLQRKYTPHISPLEDLPEKYVYALLRFRHYLNQALKGPLGQLKNSVTASPPLRKFFVRQIPQNGSLSRIVVISKPGHKKSKIETELFWLLSTLWEDGEQLFLARVSTVVDELDRLLNSEASANSLISAHIAGVIADISCLAECLRQLETYQPWANGLESAMVNHQDSIISDFAEFSKSLSRILDSLSESQIGDLGRPISGRFNYPVTKRRTKETVEALRSAEANLDAFWAKVDQHIYQKAGSLEATALNKMLRQPRALQRTSEWIEPQVPLTARDSSQRSQIMPLSSLFGNIETQRSSTRSDSSESMRHKVKLKTRGHADPSMAASVEDHTDTTDTTSSEISFTVDARAFKVFRTLFYNPEVTSSPGEIPWKDFLHAMTSAGFQAVQLRGSAWQFTPTRLSVERGIQFHEPHPVNKISFTVARRYGRRLQRAYGWWGGIFSLEPKDRS